MNKVLNITPLLSRKVELLVIGISTGGPETLGKLWQYMRPQINVPIIIVQHSLKGFENEMIYNLENHNNKIHTQKAIHRSIINKGEIYIAPGGKQLEFYHDPMGNGIKRFKILDESPINDCIPSIDYVLKSAVEIYGENVATIIMTGMGSDGAKGAKLVSERGGLVIVQNPDDCVVDGMPRAVLLSVKNVDYISSLKELGEIISFLK